MESTVKTIFDNSKDGRPSFNIKTEDGRTRRQREDKGEISSISDVTPGTELKNT